MILLNTAEITLLSHFEYFSYSPFHTELIWNYFSWSISHLILWLLFQIRSPIIPTYHYFTNHITPCLPITLRLFCCVLLFVLFPLLIMLLYWNSLSDLFMPFTSVIVLTLSRASNIFLHWNDKQ